jgi:hypothetical protein
MSFASPSDSEHSQISLFFKFCFLGEKMNSFEIGGKRLESCTCVSRVGLWKLGFHAKLTWYSESASKAASNNIFIKIFFSSNFDCTPPQLFFTQLWPPVSSVRVEFWRKKILINVLFDAAFDADSEYHVSFAWKPNFHSPTLETQVQLSSLSPPISKEFVFSPRKQNFKKSDI